MKIKSQLLTNQLLTNKIIYKNRKVLDTETYQPHWTIRILDPDHNPHSQTLDPVPHPDHHPNANDWSLGHAPLLQKI